MKPLHKTCNYCCEVFFISKAEGPKTFSKRKYCSAKCHQKSKIIKTTPKNCLICGVLFNKKPGNSINYYIATAKYCSQNCLSLSQRKYKEHVFCSFCSKKTKPRVTSRKRNKKFYCSRICYANSLKTLTQKKSPRWEGGKTSLAIAIRTGYQYKDWRNAVFTRDNYTCQHCFKRGGRLEADHIITVSNIIKAFRIKNVEDARNNFFLWEKSNGRTLCKSCHISRHKNMV
jgi:hypothetical protein